MKLETPLIALIIASLFFVGLFTVFMSVGDEYDVNYDLSVLQTQNNATTVYDAFDRLNRTKTEIDSVNSDFEDTIFGNDDSLFPFYSITLKIGKSVFRSLTIFKDIMQIFVEVLGIPPEFTIAFFAVLTVSFIILVIFILMGRST